MRFLMRPQSLYATLAESQSVTQNDGYFQCDSLRDAIHFTPRPLNRKASLRE